MTKIYLDENNCYKTFRNKSKQLQKNINEALEIADSFGIPIDKQTLRRKERVGLCILALAGIIKNKNWSSINEKKLAELKSRDIITFVNKHLEENISPGSYDDIRRKDLKLLVLGEVVLNSNPQYSPNDSRRAYVLSPEHAKAIKHYGKPAWKKNLTSVMKGRKTLSEKIARKRKVKKIPIKINGKIEEFSPGEHNELQQQIIDNMLPIFGHGAEILYIGDTTKKQLFKNEDKLKKLKFFELEHGMLPDIIAYSKSENWLFLVEAVHTSNPISELRKIELEKLIEKCTAKIIYVSAFLNRTKHREYSSNIAWETEVWIAESPDHMMHLNGDKFLGPY